MHFRNKEQNCRTYHSKLQPFSELATLYAMSCDASMLHLRLKQCKGDWGYLKKEQIEPAAVTFLLMMLSFFTQNTVVLDGKPSYCLKTVESKLNWINFDPKIVFATESRYWVFSRIERSYPLVHTSIYSFRKFLCYQCLLRYRVSKEKRFIKLQSLLSQ